MENSVKKAMAKVHLSRALIALAYSAGRDQDNHSSKAAHANSSQDPILKLLISEKG
jgi:hypothetical protein